MTRDVWRNLLDSEDTECPLAAPEEIDQVTSIMVHWRIDPEKFNGNLSAILRSGIPSIFGEEHPLPTTPSIANFTSPLDRPKAPLWLLAGFPDVVAWLDQQRRALLETCADENDLECAVAALIGFSADDVVPETELEDSQGNLRARYQRNLIDNFVRQTGRKPEVAVEEGSDNDIYLGQRLLDASGEESNFTLIASFTTKYFMELKRNYSHMLRHETSLLAMAGLCDAIMYLANGQLAPDQIVRLAKATEGEEHRFVKFLLAFEALLLSADSPEFSLDEVTEACYAQSKAIAKSVLRTMQSYKGEPMVAEAVRNVMTSKRFEDLRGAAGVQNESISSRIRRRLFG